MSILDGDEMKETTIEIGYDEIITIKGPPAPVPPEPVVPPLEGLGKYVRRIITDYKPYDGNPNNYYDSLLSAYTFSDVIGEEEFEVRRSQSVSYAKDYVLGGMSNWRAYQVHPRGLALGHWSLPLHDLAFKFPYRDEKYKDLNRWDRIREISMYIESLLAAKEVGFLIDEDRLDWLVKNAAFHLDDYAKRGEVVGEVKPFMIALVIRALIAEQDVEPDNDALDIFDLMVLTTKVADRLMAEMWLGSSFAYSDEERFETPDLNLMMSPIWGWLFKVTGQEKYRETHDLIFNHGVDAYLGSTKQFHQYALWSRDGIEWTGRKLK